MSHLKGLDAWIVSGRYSWEYLLVECSHCHENTIVKAEQEYGSVGGSRRNVNIVIFLLMIM